MDLLSRGLDSAKAVRVVAAVTTSLVREAATRHRLRGAAAVLLGRGLTAGCLLATLTKRDDERVRIAMRGDGPLGRVLVDAHGDGRVRGCFVNERTTELHVPLGAGRAVLGPLVGNGQITVTRDLGLENTYQGVVELRTGELDEDLERYLTGSEQLPSVMRCHVMVGADGEVVRAAGVLAQTFPGADPERLDRIRGVLEGDGLADVLRQDREVDALMGFALGGEGFHAAEPTALRFSCGCGRERARSVVSTLGAEDIDALADEQGGTEVRCSYCGDTYELSEADLRALAAELREQRS
ncbi:Hsp33 family molecular chaperone HslO [Paraliomyxa miuraensis]|uniref:Hsp33 family molecular chaperone HslO n=1 Tax=Paraliomyxa miuraensis TaxID=376150 RepID=UPI0022550734|nr:Hsp33 family molecular chaperone HslO [Paraliomyxa miuraensis]MCX4241709.1 Hsp33 family molecular chaperone HslO [Paraliomyxa miuraensis]